MNKAQLVDAIALESGLTKADSARALNAFTLLVSDTLAGGNKIELIGFGTFSTVKRAARTGRNPSNGAVIQIAAKTVAKFKAGSKLNAAM